MLSSQNSGKHLYGKWHRDRESAMVDRTRFDSDELNWLEITGQQGTGRYDSRTYMIETQPVDPRTLPSQIDIRKVIR